MSVSLPAILGLQTLAKYPAVCIRTDRVHPILVGYFVFGD
jgi:hypothetical protein